MRNLKLVLSAVALAAVFGGSAFAQDSKSTAPSTAATTGTHQAPAADAHHAAVAKEKAVKGKVEKKSTADAKASAATKAAPATSNPITH